MDPFRKTYITIKHKWRELPSFLHFLSWFVLRVKKRLKINFNNKKVCYSREPIDVIIPTTSKDFELINASISSLNNLLHPVNKIFIVAENNKTIIDFCRNNDYMFVDEKKLLGYSKEKINYTVNGLDRSGWLFQQLLKLSGDKITEMENYFVIDSDTLLINKTLLIENNRFIFFQNEEWHKPYFSSFKKLFGYKTKNKLSFTSHMMIINRNKLKLMKSEIEMRHNCSWDEAYINSADLKNKSSISDYENYANWVLCNFANEVIQKPLYNKALPRSLIENDIEKFVNRYRKKYNTLSFHSYIK